MAEIVDYYDEEKWGEAILSKPELYQREIKSIEIIKNLNLKKAKFLDLGCGIGFFMDQLSKHTKKDLDLWGVDYSDYNVKKAKKLPFKFEKCDIEKGIPFKDEFFDMVYSAEVIEHILNPDGMLQECNRVLKPGGYVLITTPNLTVWYNRILVLFGLQPIFYETSTKSPSVGAGILKKIKKGNIPVGHVRIFTIRAMRDLLENEGFEVVTVKGAHFAALPRPLRMIDNLFTIYPRLSSGMLVLARKKGTDEQKKRSKKSTSK
jgi:ubiquinone/menaquinone biosynthesis C-methylase UbiE